MSQLKSFLGAMLVSALGLWGPPVAAQGLFDPVVVVNDSVVTEFEVEQRIRFLTLLNAPGASREAVIEALIDERLRGEAVAGAGLSLSPEALAAGLEEFAARVNLSADEFIVALEESGIARETFEDFVRTGIAWRDYIGARFGRRLEVSEKEVDQALGSTSGDTTIRVLVSEIIIPAPPERAREVEELAERIAASETVEEFSEYARQYSATATRADGGRLDWQSLSNLPPILRPLLLALAPGEVTEPIAIPDAVALFQLRDIRETGAPSETFVSIDYAAYYIPGGRSEASLAQANRIRAEVDGCDDLYGVAYGQPPEVLERGAKPTSEIPADVALELSKLDPGESSVALTRSNGQTLMFLMLCGRTAAANEAVAREDVAASLRSRRLNDIAASFLDQLRADARISLP